MGLTKGGPISISNSNLDRVKSVKANKDDQDLNKEKEQNNILYI